MNSVNANMKYILLGTGGLAVLVGLVAFMQQRQSAANTPPVAPILALPASTPGRATGYKGAELMPAPPGAVRNITPMGHATGYKNSNLMPAPPARP